jgi:hypothetical protein
MLNVNDQRPSGPPDVAFDDQPPLAYPAALRALAGCAVRVVALLCRRRMHRPTQWVRTRLRFADGTSAPVYRETVIDYGAAPARCVLVVTFTLRWVRGWGHAVFRAESLLNTVLFAGFPGSIHYVVLPGLARDDFLREPQAAGGPAPEKPLWWRVVECS